MLTIGRSGPRWNPWLEMERFEREASGLLSGLGRSRTAGFPPINVLTSENEVIVTSEMPGVDPADVDLSVNGDILTIKGTRKPQELAEGQKWHRRERGQGNFYRTVQLPFNVESSKVNADYAKGVLTVKLPRAEADKPRKITVKTA
ncbi:MAG TPA: Hsp20/alpha crystallin family protein [Deltaproteobacteria bacterium]|nr:Hsp20/alpha crystallin family protein [Deltaproteobacteria bacterium]HPJ94346.1 Hsp20/alpha crystallin family protein [Deltaproteobacteria bacterium]HPR52358.1 Hsp20/alpha crystallin family protein [Deltaproteobacteria bacterium]